MRENTYFCVQCQCAHVLQVYNNYCIFEEYCTINKTKQHEYQRVLLKTPLTDMYEVLL